MELHKINTIQDLIDIFKKLDIEFYTEEKKRTSVVILDKNHNPWMFDNEYYLRMEKPNGFQYSITHVGVDAENRLLYIHIADNVSHIIRY